MGDEVDYVEARYALLVQVINRVRVFLAKNRHQHVSAVDFFFAVASGLHMHDGALNHALKTQRWLRIDLIDTSDLWGVVFDEVGQRTAQIINVGRASAQHFGGAGVVEQCKQQMLHGNELVALLAGLYKGHVQAYFQFLGNHVNSLVLA